MAAIAARPDPAALPALSDGDGFRLIFAMMGCQQVKAVMLHGTSLSRARSVHPVRGVGGRTVVLLPSSARM